MITFGIIGLLIGAYSIWVRKERIQNILFVVGGVFLLMYSLYIEDVVFVVLQIIFILSAAVELIKISRK